MNLRRLVTIGMLLNALAVGTHAQQSPLPTPYKPPVTVTVTPIFVKGSPITFTLAFQMPAGCLEQRFALRVYPMDTTTTDPSFKTKALAETLGFLNPAPAQNTRITVKFFPVTLSNSAPSKIQLVLWNVCTRREPKGIDPGSGKIIWNVEDFGTRLFGATYAFNCPGSKTDVCFYKRD